MITPISSFPDSLPLRGSGSRNDCGKGIQPPRSSSFKQSKNPKMKKLTTIKHAESQLDVKFCALKSILNYRWETGWSLSPADDIVLTMAWWILLYGRLNHNDVVEYIRAKHGEKWLSVNGGIPASIRSKFRRLTIHPRWSLVKHQWTLRSSATIWIRH